ATRHPLPSSDAAKRRPLHRSLKGSAPSFQQTHPSLLNSASLSHSRQIRTTVSKCTARPTVRTRLFVAAPIRHRALILAQASGLPTALLPCSPLRSRTTRACVGQVRPPDDVPSHFSRPRLFPPAETEVTDAAACRVRSQELQFCRAMVNPLHKRAPSRFGFQCHPLLHAMGGL